jgi:hypothetical protein
MLKYQVITNKDLSSPKLVSTLPHPIFKVYVPVDMTQDCVKRDWRSKHNEEDGKQKILHKKFKAGSSLEPLSRSTVNLVSYRGVGVPYRWVYDEVIGVSRHRDATDVAWRSHIPGITKDCYDMLATPIDSPMS